MKHKYGNINEFAEIELKRELRYYERNLSKLEERDDMWGFPVETRKNQIYRGDDE